MKLELSYVHDFATRYATAWCSQNPAAVAAFFSSNGSLTINDRGSSVGREAIMESAREFMSTFPDLRVALDNVAIQGESVEFHWTLTGTNTGPGGTGHVVRISGFEAWIFSDDGLVAKSLGHFDAADYQRQLAHGFEPQ